MTTTAEEERAKLEARLADEQGIVAGDDHEERKVGPSEPLELIQELRPLNLGNSVRIVGEVSMRDPEQDPHAINRRGELGKPMYNWYYNTVSNDPISRMAFATHAPEPRGLVSTATGGRNARGKVNPNRVPVTDAKAMTAHIKKVAKFLGADAVGIAPVHPSLFYKGGARLDDYARESERGGGDSSPEEMTKRYPYAIVCLDAWDYHMGRAHRHRIGDFAYAFSAQRNTVLQANLGAYLRELGYAAVQGAVNPMPMALAAGLGELGRNGLVISEKFGARTHPSVLLTDLPLVPDKPVDLGVPEFCAVCRKCATSCPTNSIPHGDKTVINGVEKYAINWKTCYALRPVWSSIWQFCLTCVTVCPYTKENTWWHSLTIKALRTTPRKLRSLIVRPLIWLDNRIWGEVPRDRVQFLGYDSGRMPSIKTCTIAGCTCGDHDTPVEGKANMGYYAPLKENTNRFVKRA
jgi:reductive dehalogenase